MILLRNTNGWTVINDIARLASASLSFYLNHQNNNYTKELLGYQTEDFTTESKWKNVDNLIEYNERYKNQRENYKKYIEGKPVIETVNAACNFLLTEYTKLKLDS